MRRNSRGRGIRGTFLLVASYCHLRSCGSRLGAHLNLDRVRKVCVYVKGGITVAVIEGMFVSDRQVDEASAETRGTQTRSSASMWGASGRGAELTYVLTLGFHPSTPPNRRSEWRISSIQNDSARDMEWVAFLRVSFVFGSSHQRRSADCIKTSVVWCRRQLYGYGDTVSKSSRRGCRLYPKRD